MQPNICEADKDFWFRAAEEIKKQQIDPNYKPSGWVPRSRGGREMVLEYVDQLNTHKDKGWG